MKPLKRHPISDIFPEMSPDEFQALIESIKRSGLHESIILYESQILDGWHRYRACLELGIEPKTNEFTGDNPLELVLIKHTRRNLSASQKAIVAARLTIYKPEKKLRINPQIMTENKAADVFQVSRSMISKAKRIIREQPEAIPSIEKGLKTVIEIDSKIKKENKQREQAEKQIKQIEARKKGLNNELSEKAQASFNQEQKIEKEAEYNHGMDRKRHLLTLAAHEIMKGIAILEESENLLSSHEISNTLKTTDLDIPRIFIALENLQDLIRFIEPDINPNQKLMFS